MVIIYHFSWNSPFLTFVNFKFNKNWNIYYSLFDDLTLRLEKLAAVPKRHFCTGLPWQADISAGLHLLSTRPNRLLLVLMFSPSGTYSYNLVDTLEKYEMRNMTAHLVKGRPDWPGYIDVGDNLSPTSGCWWFCVGKKFWVLMTIFESWCTLLYK